MKRSALLATVLLALVSGRGASQSTEQLYQAACDAGEHFVCNLFGIMYESGDGVPQDPGRAAELYLRACEGGELRGCTNLALLYESGALGADLPRALGLLRVGCEGGEALACERLEEVRETSRGGSAATFSRTGRIGVAESGRALDEALIEVGGLNVRAISNAEGRFELSDLPSGTHVVRATRVGYDPAIGEIEVPGNGDFVILLTPTVLGDARAPGRVEGRVVDDADQGLPAVEIVVPDDPRLRTITNQQGRFTLRDVEPGLTEVRFVHLGYAPRTAAVVVQPGRTVELLTRLVPQPIELEAIQVVVRSRYLEQNGFYHRRDDGWGVHFTPYDIERIDPIEVSDLLRERVPGIRIQYGQGGEARVVSRRSVTPTMGPCVLPIYIDGVRAFDEDLDRFPPEQIEAMEVYPGIGNPVEFISQDNPCGLVLLWTRRGA